MDAASRDTAPGSALPGSPTAIEVVRVASRLTGADAEIVLFDGPRASVVASIGRSILQPRPYTEAERAILDGTTDPDYPGHATAEGASYPIVHSDGSTIGALSVGPHDVDHEIFASLARVVSMITPPVASDDPIQIAVLDSLRDAVIVVDANWTVTYASQSVAIQLGRSPVEVIGTNAVDLLHPDDIGEALEAMARLANGDEVYRIVVRVQMGSGEYVRIEVTGRDLTDDPRIQGTVLSLRNGDHDLEIESVLARTEQVSNTVVEQLHDGIIATDAVGSLTVVNSAARKIFGLDPDVPLAEIQIDDLVFRDGDSRPVNEAEHPIRRLLNGDVIFEEEAVVVAGGSVRNLTISGRPVLDKDGTPLGTAIAVHDVTTSKRAERDLLTRALHDQLTGLPNRRQLEEHLLMLRQRHRRREDKATLVAGCLVDVDNFKLINDTHGHRAGDMVIRGVADMLLLGRREGDMVARLGGDEFIVVFEVENRDEALEIAESLRATLAGPLSTGDEEYMLTASIGVTLQAPNELRQDAFLRTADIALYAAKDSGRNRVEIFDNAMAQATHVAEAQRTMLRRALDDDGLVMQFQPLVSASDHRLVGFESLARCRTTDGSLVGPSRFVGAAAGSGLVWELDRQAFDLACDAASVISEAAPDLTVACNFSALSIQQGDFLHEIQTTMERRNVDPKNVCVEITESAAFEAGPGALGVLQQIADLGIKLALDDFGTGYSSLAHLRDLPLSIVKVDRSFINNLTDVSSDLSIVKAIVALAADLDLTVVAEGVETDTQLDIAKQLGFDTIQGYYFSEALDLQAIIDMLATGHDPSSFALPTNMTALPSISRRS